MTKKKKVTDLSVKEAAMSFAYMINHRDVTNF